MHSHTELQLTFTLQLSVHLATGLLLFRKYVYGASDGDSAFLQPWLTSPKGFCVVFLAPTQLSLLAICPAS